MEKGDILTLAGGILIVFVIALVANPQYLAAFSGAGAGATPTLAPTPTPIPVPADIPLTITTPTSIEPTPTPVLADAPPYQIFYSDKPFSYPVFKLPENMETFGASNSLSGKQEMVPFAFVEGKQGGLTQTFSVPYPLWVLNTTVTADATPQYGMFRMALCYAANGNLIEGEEILNRGTSYRIVQTSNTDLYMIISTAYIDGYRINLETSREYYDLYRPRP